MGVSLSDMGIPYYYIKAIIFALKILDLIPLITACKKTNNKKPLHAHHGPEKCHPKFVTLGPFAQSVHLSSEPVVSSLP